MKIGIVTFHGAQNYGAALQVWALQTTLERRGHEVKIVNYRPWAIDKIYRIYTPLDYFKKIKFLNKFIHLYQKIYYHLAYKYKFERKRKFDNFIADRLNLTQLFTNKTAVKKENFDFDLLITGSDQVWNTDITNGFDDIFFLNFGNEQTRRISYAASMGFTAFKSKYANSISLALQRLDAISVREDKVMDAVKEVVDIPVYLTLDPTLLLDASDYDEVKKNCGQTGDFIYVHNVHLNRVDDALNEVAESLSAKLGLPVVYNNNNYKYSNQKALFNNAGPEEFVDIISKAKYVVSNSFHATIFSILFNIPFITVPHFRTPDRMIFLLKSLGLENHLINKAEDIPDNLDELQIDEKAVQDKIEQMRTASFDYLDAAISGENNQIPEKFAKHKVYMGYEKSDDELMTVSSGGFSSCISRTFIEKGGLVVGVKYSDDFRKAEYAVASTIDELEQFKTSKYIETDKFVNYNGQKKLVFQLVSDLLQEGKEILFFGLGCDAAAVKGCCEKNGTDTSSLYVIDLICHGPTYPEVQKQYVDKLEQEYSSKVVSFSTKSKVVGWDSPYIRVEFASGEVYQERFTKTEFGRAFASYIRKACFDCKFRDSNRASDLTVGDYWGAYKCNPNLNLKGTSVIFVNSDQGQKLLDMIDRTTFFMAETDPRVAILGNTNYFRQPRKSAKYDEYAEIFKRDGLLEADRILKK